MKIAGSRRGGILMGLILTAGVIITFAVVTGIYVAHNVRVRPNRSDGNDVSIDIPGGHFSIRGRDNLDPATLGVPIYPGATRVKKGGGATFEWTSSDGKEGKGFSVAGGDLFTRDSADKVLDYYRGQLPNWIVITDRDGSTRLEFKDGGAKRIIAIREKSDGTHIGVATIGEPASN